VSENQPATEPKAASVDNSTVVHTLSPRQERQRPVSVQPAPVGPLNFNGNAENDSTVPREPGEDLVSPNAVWGC
jgi:hypothetical protein